MERPVFNPEDYPELKVNITAIPGLLEFKKQIFSDERGWFQESFQREKLVALGLPESFAPVQNNVSYNKFAGTTRGIHGEPWDKYIAVLGGSAFAAIVDFRSGDNFGRVEVFELTPGNAIFVPKGCGNSFQALEDNTIYSYLVNSHWSPDSKYTMANLADKQLAIKWPIPLEQAIISDKDKSEQPFSAVTPLEITK